MTNHESPPADHWWRAVEDEVARRNADIELPDPWAAAVPEVPELTDDQRDLLLGLDDQPRVARLSQFDPDDSPSDVGLEIGASADGSTVDPAVDGTTPWHEGFDLGDDHLG